MTKMRVTVVLALTVVILAAMIGQVVGAWNGGIHSTDINENPKYSYGNGELVYAIGETYNDPDTGDGDDNLEISVTVNKAWAVGDVITPVVSTSIGPLVKSGDRWPIPKTYLGTVSNAVGGSNIPYPGTYDIVVDLDEDGTFDSEDIVSTLALDCGEFITVPEFTMVALPILSVLGLLLFFYHRKHKKE